MDNNVYIFLHITLVTSSSTVDLTPNFSESNYLYPYYKWHKLTSDNTNSYGVIKKLNYVFPRNVLLAICKSFVRPHLDYGDILYHQPNNENINNKLESVQYSAALAIIGAIKGTSRSKLRT